MFDYHMHSRVSFDAHDTGEALARAALKAGLKEICFTDHLDYDPLGKMGCMAFDNAAYSAEYDRLVVPGLKIRRGMEFGMTADNVAQFREDLKRRPFDFVLGSIHFVDDLDVYFEEWWSGKTVAKAERRYLDATLECVKLHDDFDVLAHLTYIAKTRCHPSPRPVPYGPNREVVDEILRTLAAKGKGLELNTSGMDRCGDYLPGAEYFRRFKELGGEIVTVGSDAHTADRVGQYSREACQILKDIFGYVCTFEGRKPIFHKL
ncbi:MAG: histidinol-phosphatase HisJ family protein [Oscillospiraceae bacterium]|nr:histidinol-phosphatase HisJ family protein [Oscillospiraceae bacterium]MBR2422045.1 histidinol-phosphatase HisJ family protein [Oscillospiraceae bacterium]